MQDAVIVASLKLIRYKLLHWYNFELEEVVAEGTITSKDPSATVHHLPLGRDCWKVWVDEVFDEELKLYIAIDEAYKLVEALGSTIVWPKSFVKVLNEGILLFM